MKNSMNIFSIVTAAAAGIMLIAATEGVFARDNTGTRPIGSAAGKPFNINGGPGKGIGGEPTAGLGGSMGGVPLPPRRHRHW